MSNIVIVGEISDVLRAQGNPLATGVAVDATAGSPIVGGQYSYIPQVNVGIMTMEDFNESVSSYTKATNNTSKNPFNSVGAVGLDAIFTPYSTHTDSGRSPFLPHFTSPSGTPSGPTSKTLNPFNPFYGLSGLSTAGNSLANDLWMRSGHNISFATTYNPHDSGVTGLGGYVGSTGTYPNGSGSPTNIFFEKDHFARKTVEIDGIRSVGLRSPMILSGWGYDTGGAPVPSSGGKIHPEAAWNPAIWKSGPVDFRWDDSRGVWSTGGNTDSIWFTVYDSICADSYTERHLIAIPTWSTGGCSAVIPGIDSSGYVTIYDICSVLAYYTDAGLPGKTGRATYMYPRTGSCTPRWIVDTICGETECG